MDKEALDCKPFHSMYEHAWRYFELHANQRIALFRFYIVFFSIFATAACFLLIRFPYNRVIHEFSGIFLGLVFVALTIVFHLLDKRNRQLIDYAENGLRYLEQSFVHEMQIFTQEDLDCKNKNSCIQHSSCFNTIFIAGYIMGVMYVVFSILCLVYYTGLHNII